MSPSFLPVACALAVLASVTGAAGHEGLEEAVSLLQRFQSLEDNGHRTPVIIDTDADTDDQMAIAFVLLGSPVVRFAPFLWGSWAPLQHDQPQKRALMIIWLPLLKYGYPYCRNGSPYYDMVFLGLPRLAQPDIEVLAITVGCDGWSQQWAGVVSVMRLTQYFGQPDIPVAYSPFYNSDTQLNLKEPNKLPNPRLQTGLGNFLSQHVGLPFNMRPPSWMYTGLLLQETLRRSRRKVNVIALGPLTNLAHFLQESPRLFERKVDRIYFSGGIVVPRSSSPTDKVWPYSAPDTSFTGNPPGTEWNVFSDPVAANSVFSFGKSLVLATSTYTEGMRFFLNDTDFIPASCDGDRAAVLTKLVTTLSVAANEAPEDLRYWDESAVVLFVQMIRNLCHRGATFLHFFRVLKNSIRNRNL